MVHIFQVCVEISINSRGGNSFKHLYFMSMSNCIRKKTGFFLSTVAQVLYGEGGREFFRIIYIFPVYPNDAPAVSYSHA